jgi:nitrogen fixation protein FixH
MNEMSNAGAAPAQPTSAWRSPWVIGWIGLVVVVLGVNITMVVLAIATNPGLVSKDYYEEGQDVEQMIVSRMAEGPGWTMRIDVPAEVAAQTPTKVYYVVVDKAGQPVSPDQVTYLAYRPSDATRDFSRPMIEEGRGRYTAEVVFPLAGVWDTAVAVRDGDAEYSVSLRVSVARP